VSELTPHAARNRAAWDAYADEYQRLHSAQLDASGGDAWGMWQQPEASLGVLGDVSGLDVLELGCGAARWSAALARRGARCTALDLSPRQIELARATVAGLDVTLVEASAEDVPLPDASFDVIFTDHGAFTFADPLLVMPQCARLLRPGGLLAFSMMTPIVDLVWPLDVDDPTQCFVRDYFDLRSGDDGRTVGFQLPYGAWVRLFREHGFVIEDLIELRPPAGAVSSYRSAAATEWARRWPIEHIWKARSQPGALPTAAFG
jgi:SAM-dependent methyltransferase